MDGAAVKWDELLVDGAAQLGEPLRVLTSGKQCADAQPAWEAVF